MKCSSSCTTSSGEAVECSEEESVVLPHEMTSLSSSSRSRVLLGSGIVTATEGVACVLEDAAWPLSCGVAPEGWCAPEEDGDCCGWGAAAVRASSGGAASSLESEIVPSWCHDISSLYVCPSASSLPPVLSEQGMSLHVGERLVIPYLVDPVKRVIRPLERIPPSRKWGDCGLAISKSGAQGKAYWCTCGGMSRHGVKCS
eukprot:5194623-Amphidinium_carterae.1